MVVLMFAFVALLLVAGIRLFNLAMAAAPPCSAFVLWSSPPVEAGRVVAFRSLERRCRRRLPDQQSLIAIGSGGIFGSALGLCPAGSLPTGAEADFVMAIVGEETRPAGGAGRAGVVLLVSYAGLRTAMIAATRYRMLLAAGSPRARLAAILNVLMVLGLVPVIAIGCPSSLRAGNALRCPRRWAAARRDEAQGTIRGPQWPSRANPAEA